MKKSTRLNNILKERYDLDLLSGSLNPDHLMGVYKYYKEQYDGRLLESAQNGKAFLISEAALMILKEIAPRRTKKKKGVK